MSERGCVKCGYILTGLPASGTVVTCPECGHATDLAYPLPRRMSVFRPIVWGMAPLTLAIPCGAIATMFGHDAGGVGVALLGMGVLSGAFIAALLTSDRLRLEPALGRAPRPPLVRVALAALAGFASVVVNAAVLFAIFLGFLAIIRR